MHRLLQAIIPLFLLSLTFAGCSSDEDKDAEPIDGWVITAFSGEKLLMKGGVLKSDSVSFNWWISKVPYKPIIKEEVPNWLPQEMGKHGPFMQRYVYQGEMKETGRPVYVVKCAMWGNDLMFDADGNSTGYVYEDGENYFDLYG